MKRGIAAIVALVVCVLVAQGAFARATGESGATGTTAAGGSGAYKEAPMLAQMVAAGTLPPVSERLPDNPKVVEMIESVGKYGGDLILLATNTGIGGQDLQGQWGVSFFRNPRTSVGLEMDVAEGYEVNAEKTAVTLFLREGMKWSDGAPFTSEDVRFAFEDMHFNPQVATWGPYGIDRVEVIDDTTVTLINDQGLGTNLLQMSTWFGGYVTSFHPAHYLKKWHIDYNADAGKVATEEGYENWWTALRFHFFWAPLQDVNKPEMEPWQLTQFETTVKVAERNPYFFRVDPAGNQLPYIDRKIMQIVDPEVYQLKLVGGEASLGYAWTRLENMQLYKTNERSGDYRVILHPGVASSEVKLIVNQNHPDQAMRAILNDIRFKQAVSVSINREEVQNTIYQGLGRARGQVAPLESVSFYKQGWRDHYAQYDPTLANRLLDQAGLNRRGADGFRLRSDGQPLSLVINYTVAGQTAELELVSEYMNAVGLKTTIRLIDDGLMDQLHQTSDYHFWVHGNPNQPWSNERSMFQLSWVWSGSANMQQWEDWAAEKYTAVQTMLGGPSAVIPADWRRLETPTDDDIQYEEPPEEYIYQEELMERWNATEMGTAEYKRLAQEFFDWYVTRLHYIGIVGEIPSIMIAKNQLGNVLSPGWVAGVPLQPDYTQTWQDQLYWKNR